MADIQANLRNYFHDFEFLDPETVMKPPVLISGGIVNEEGQRFYGVKDKLNEAWIRAQNPWIGENVLDKLPPESDRLSFDAIQDGIMAVIKPSKIAHFWAKNGAYDVNMLCRVFGGMNNFRARLKLEKGIEEVRFRDTWELKHHFGAAKIAPMDPKKEHISIEDAAFERQVFGYYASQGLIDPHTGRLRLK